MNRPPSRDLKKIRKEGIAPPHFHQKLDRSQAAAPTSTFEVVDLFFGNGERGQIFTIHLRGGVESFMIASPIAIGLIAWPSLGIAQIRHAVRMSRISRRMS